MRWLRATAVGLISAAIGGVLAFVGVFLVAVALAVVWNLLGWLGLAVYHLFTPRDWRDVKWAKDLLGIAMVVCSALAALLVGTTFFRSELAGSAKGDEAGPSRGGEGQAAPEGRASGRPAS